MITAPSDPAHGDSVLEWARKVNALLRLIIPRDSDDVWWQLTPGGAKPTLRRRRGGEVSGAAADAIQLGFGWYNAPFEGEGDRPANQGLIIRLYEGVINGNIVPDNMGSEFTLENNQTQYLRCTTSQDAAGLVTSAALDTTLTLAADPSGALDVAPATSSRALWKFTTLNNEITEAIALRIGGLDVTAVVDDMDCGSVQLRMFWGAALAAV